MLGKLSFVSNGVCKARHKNIFEKEEMILSGLSLLINREKDTRNSLCFISHSLLTSYAGRQTFSTQTYCKQPLHFIQKRFSTFRSGGEGKPYFRQKHWSVTLTHASATSSTPGSISKLRYSLAHYLAPVWLLRQFYLLTLGGGGGRAVRQRSVRQIFVVAWIEDML